MSSRLLLLTIEEVGALFGVKRRAAYLMTSRPDFPKPVRVGLRAIRWRAADVENYVAQLPTVNSFEPPQLRAGKTARRAQAPVRPFSGLPGAAADVHGT